MSNPTYTYDDSDFDLEYVRSLIGWDHFNDVAWPEQLAAFDRWIAGVKAQVLEDFATTYSWEGHNTDGIEESAVAERQWILELALRRASVLRKDAAR